MLMQVQRDLTLGEAAKAIGVSPDTLRRWDRTGKLRTRRDARNRRMVPTAEVRRLTRRRHARMSGIRIGADLARLPVASIRARVGRNSGACVFYGNFINAALGLINNF